MSEFDREEEDQNMIFADKPLLTLAENGGKKKKSKDKRGNK